MDENENERAPRKISLGFIISFLMVIAIVGVMIYFFFFNSRPSALKQDQFYYYAYNDQVTEITGFTPKENTVISITGTYLKDKSKPKEKTSFNIS